MAPEMSPEEIQRLKDWVDRVNGAVSLRKVFLVESESDASRPDTSAARLAIPSRQAADAAPRPVQCALAGDSMLRRMLRAFVGCKACSR